MTQTSHRDLEHDEELAIPSAPSPYAGKHLTFADHLPISAYWFATNALWGALLPLMLPGEIRTMAPHHRVLALGLLSGLSAIVALVVPLFVGALSDRCTSKHGRRRPFIVGGALLNLVGLAFMAVVVSSGAQVNLPPDRGETGKILIGLLSSPVFLVFLAAYIVVQFGNNIATAAYSGLIPDLVPAEQFGAASGYMATMSQAGTLCGALVCGLLLGKAPEAYKYAFLGFVLVAVGSITVFGIKESPLPEKPKPIRWGKYVRSLWIDPRTYPDFAWVWITRALVMLGFYAILPFINYYLIDVIGIEHPENPASILTAIILVFASISGILGGYISDRTGRKPVVYWANATIAIMTLAFIFCRSLPQVFLAGVLFGLGYGAYISVDWALGSQVLPTKENAAKEMAVWHISMTLPQTLAAPVAGMLIQIYGSPTIVPGHHELTHYRPSGYAAVFIMAAVCFALGAYLLRNVRGVK